MGSRHSLVTFLIACPKGFLPKDEDVGKGEKIQYLYQNWYLSQAILYDQFYFDSF